MRRIKTVLIISVLFLFVTNTICLGEDSIAVDVDFHITIDQQQIYPKKTVITGNIGSYELSSSLVVLVNNQIITDIPILSDNGIFSVTIDFSNCFPGDKVVFSRKYMGERDDLYLMTTAEERTILKSESVDISHEDRNKQEGKESYRQRSEKR